MDSGKQCCCPCHKMKGILVFVLGLVFLLGNLEVISQSIVMITWPIIVMLIGLKKMCLKVCKCCSTGGSCSTGK